MSIIIRPICDKDLIHYVTFSQQANFGFTSLPRDQTLVTKQFEHALDSFRKTVHTPGEEFYLFVAEDVNTQQLLGISAIQATTGGRDPLFFLRQEHYEVSSSLTDVVKKIPVLSPVSYVRSTTEMCSLYVSPEARKKGAGTLLSLSRFLFIKAFQTRFTATIFAELRGIVEHAQCPFWDSVGRHFFDKSIEEVYEMLQYGRAFIAEFLPKYPIYQALLPKEVQAVIGMTAQETKGALGLLESIGFKKTGEVDVFDAGPKLACLSESVSIIREAKKVQIAAIQDTDDEAEYSLVSNMRLDFRACMAPIYQVSDAGVRISSTTAKLLNVGLADTLLVYNPQHRDMK